MNASARTAPSAVATAIVAVTLWKSEYRSGWRATSIPVRTSQVPSGDKSPWIPSRLIVTIARTGNKPVSPILVHR